MRASTVAVLLWSLMWPCMAQVPFALHDTLFIQRNIEPGDYHAVLMLKPDMSGRWADRCTALTNARTSEEMKSQITYAKEHAAAEGRVKQTPWEGCWLPLLPKRVTLYLYDACDGLFYLGMTVQSDLMIEHYGDGPLVTILRTP